MSDAAEPLIVPRLRFPEFSGAWHSKMLGDICSITTGKLDANAMVADGQYRFYTCAKEYYKIDEFAFDTEALLVSGNGANVGYIHYYRGKFNAYQRTYVLDKFSQDIKYVEQYLRENLSERIGLEKKAGNTPYIVMGTLADMPLAVPTLPEQQKIADFLGAVDVRVGLLRRRREALAAYKRAMMQRLFAGTLRFTRPDGSPYPDWQEKRLGEVATFHRGASLSKADLTETGTYPAIHYGELFTEYAEVINSVRSRTSRSDCTLSVSGDILMPSSDVTPDGLGRASALSEAGVMLGGDINIIRPGNSVVSEFLSYWITQNKRVFIRLVTGTTVKHLYTSELKHVAVLLPHPEEQQKIAQFLIALESKIDAVTAQIAAMQRFKKGLLQQMFV